MRGNLVTFRCFFKLLHLRREPTTPSDALETEMRARKTTTATTATAVINKQVAPVSIFRVERPKQQTRKMQMRENPISGPAAARGASREKIVKQKEAK